jgi:hypothetical protein
MLQFLPIEFLDFDRNRSNFRTELSFPMFSNYRCRFRFRCYRFRSRFREKNMKTKMIFVPFSPLYIYHESNREQNDHHSRVQAAEEEENQGTPAHAADVKWSD